MGVDIEKILSCGWVDQETRSIAPEVPSRALSQAAEDAFNSLCLVEQQDEDGGSSEVGQLPIAFRALSGVHPLALHGLSARPSCRAHLSTTKIHGPAPSVKAPGPGLTVS